MKKLINEPPLLVLPSLAKALGLNEAILLQQLHYWLETGSHEIEGKKWVYNTYKQWQHQLPFFSFNTIVRTIKSLEEKNLVITTNFNKRKFDKTKWYSINYVELSRLLNVNPNWVVPLPNLGKPIPETTTKKIQYASKVFLEEEEFKSLLNQVGEKNTLEIIEHLNNYKEANGKYYDSDYHAIKLWVLNKVLGQKGNNNGGHNNEIVARNREIELNRLIEGDD